MLVFKGYYNEKTATLNQHINQLNFLLISVDRPELERDKERIGFDMSGD